MTDAAGTRALIVEEQRRIDVFLARQMVDRPAGQKILMIGPHPDDNLLGPGGTALKYAKAGAELHWLCISDGRACVADAAERQRMAELRAEEERECARQLGIPAPILFATPEDQLAVPATQTQVVKQLTGTLRQLQPDAVFVPYFLETHPLHRLCCHLVARALGEVGQTCQVYSWALASFPPPSVVVDISQEFVRKTELCQIYKTQLPLRDYIGELELLSRFQASYARTPSDHCEVFFAQERATFVADVLGRALDQDETLRVGVQPVVPEN
jgi:LmbE family N-acetylglucosaminyl deacetylase